MVFKIDSNNYLSLLSNLQVSIVHTYTKDIKRTLVGRVTFIPTPFRTVGVDVLLIGKVSQLVGVLNAVQVDKVTLDFTDTVYTCAGGTFSCTSAKIERLKDQQDIKGQMTISFVSVGVPTIVVDGDVVTITAPDNE